MSNRRSYLIIAMLAVLGAIGAVLIDGEPEPATAVPGDRHASAPVSAASPGVAAGEQARSARPPVRSEGADELSSEEDGREAERRADCHARCGSDCVRDARGFDVCPSLCRTSADCEGQAQCVVADRDATGARNARCLTSECANHDDCADGQACRFVNPGGGGVWLCVQAGARELGESCTTVDLGPETQCATGGQCVGGWCVPDVCASADECPTGTMCGMMAGSGHGSCVPFCQADGDCSAGELCAQIGAARRCVPRDEAGCVVDGCDAGELCQIDSDLAWAFRASCVPACASGQGTCHEDERCVAARPASGAADSFRCAADCARTDTPCEPGFRCIVNTAGHGTCHFDQRAAHSAARGDAPNF